MLTNCLHCKRYRRTERRGLCLACHRTPGVRDRFPGGRLLRAAGPCLHCKRNKGQRGKRGLCYGCALQPAVRNLYPTLSKQFDDDTPAGKVPERATFAPPGTWKKLKVLCERFDRRESLFHPNDARRLDHETADDLLPRSTEFRKAVSP